MSTASLALVSPARAALLIALAAAGCGRSDLDQPLDPAGASGQAGRSAEAAGAAGGAGLPGAGGGAGLPGAGGFGGLATGGTFAACVEGTKRCADAHTAEVCMGGAFVPSGCALGCFDGACAECVPSTATCASTFVRQACDASGVLEPTTPCPGICKNGDCVAVCADGDTRCAGVTAQESCKGGGWMPATDCPFVCDGKACTTKARRVFVTSQIFVGGDLGGLAGADDICRNLAEGAGLGSSFAAWLSDATDSPSKRFPQGVGPYELVDGTIVARNWFGLTSGTLLHGIDLTERGDPPPLGTVGCVSPAVWSGTQQNGMLAEERGHCSNWSDPTWESAVLGWVGATTRWSDACTVISGTPQKACGGMAALYCFEQ